MKPETVAEFCFTGAAVTTGLFFWLGDPGLAVVVSVPLLLGGCLASLADSGAPFRTMKPPPRRGGRARHSGSRHSVAHLRQRTRSHG